MTATRLPHSGACDRLVSLGDHDLWKLDIPTAAPVLIECLQGLAWITAEGTQGDILLPAGQRSFISGPGLLLASGLHSAMLRVIPVTAQDEIAA